MMCIRSHKKTKSSWFVFNPSFSERTIQLIPSDLSNYVKLMKFVTNKHVLVQFDKEFVPFLDENGCVTSDKEAKCDQTIIFAMDGKIITQEENSIQICLNKKIVGYSDLVRGVKYLVTLDETDENQ